MKAVRIHEHGDVDVIKWEDIDTPFPGPNKLLIDIKAVLSITWTFGFVVGFRVYLYR